MREYLYKFCVMLALICACNTLFAKIPASERAVLDNIYAQSGGSAWTYNSGWEAVAANECNWYGVYCDGTQTHVIEINLDSNNLSGTIPPLSDLTGLLIFSVNYNQLTGTLPLAGLPQLQDFYARGNQFSGAIPPLDGLNSLQQVDIGANQLTGAIPPLAGLTNLQQFQADNNGLSGPIPPLSGLVKLQQFIVATNNLSGSIPSLSGLTSLLYFSVGTNQLTGKIPSLAGLVNLQNLDLSANQLSGSIPSLSGLTNLQNFDAGYNQLTGTIPALSGLVNLITFSARGNSLSGPIPSLRGLTNLAVVLLDVNKLSGTFPSLATLSKLALIEVDNNQLTGTLPSLSEVTQLQYLRVDHNQFTGPIPALTGLTGLSYFGVDHNQLTGELPSLAGLSNLMFFFVGNNLLSGAAPATPAPINKLAAGYSSLCPNNLTVSADAAWDAATGATPWSNSCATPPVNYVIINAGSHGSIPPDTFRTIVYGATTSFVVTPDAGYTSRIVSDCGGTLSGGTFTTGPVVDFCAVAVTFVPVDYVPLNPVRIMDTRIGANFTTVDGTDAGTGPIPAGTARTLQVTTRGTLPNTAISAVALNVTPVGPTGVGYITVWSGAGAAPLAANLNLSPGRTIPNLVISQVAANGQVSIYNGGVADVDVVVDAQGYFPPSTSYVPMTPARLLDTRAGQHTVDENDAGIGAIPSASQMDLPVLTRAGIPASGVDTVILNVTAALPSNPGYVTAWSGDDALPAAANLNLNPGYTTPNLVISKVGTQGSVSLYNGGLGGTNLIADAQGWFPTNSSYTAVTPARLVDTRAGQGTIDDRNAGEGALAAGGQLDILVASRGGVPATGVGAVILNVTAIKPSSGGFLTVWPSGETRPLAANLNLNPGLTLPNLVIAKLGSDGKVSIYSGGLSPTDIVVDVQGWFAAGP